MKTIKQRDFEDLDIHPPDQNEGGNIEIWQGKAGERQSISIEKNKVKDLITILHEMISENNGIKCSIKVEVRNELGDVIGFADMPTDINELFK